MPQLLAVCAPECVCVDVFADVCGGVTYRNFRVCYLFALMYLRMFVVVLPIVIFVCVICFSMCSLLTLKRIIVDIRLPFCFLCSPSVSMFSFFNSASISCKLIWGGILFMQSQGLTSFLPARCMYRLLPNISFLYFSFFSIEFVC